jgi:hypothetical protein
MNNTSTGSAFNVVIAILVIAIIAAAVYFAWKKWGNKNGGGTTDPTVFTLDYSIVGPPNASIINGHAVKPEIDPSDIGVFYNSMFTVQDGDVIRLETRDGTEIAQKTLSLNPYYGHGDWSFLENLSYTLKVDGYMMGEYQISIYRNGQRMISRVLSSNLQYFEFFQSDYRTRLPQTADIPLVLGDFILVADPTTKVLTYLYYCIRDVDGGLFRLHPVSPNKDGDNTMTLQSILNRFSGMLIGLTNSEFQEIYLYSNPIPSATPSVPTTPTTPTDPTTPTTPTDPTTDPTTDPSKDPSTPTDPSKDPSTPTDPSKDPATPTDPSKTDPTPTTTVINSADVYKYPGNVANYPGASDSTVLDLKSANLRDGDTVQVASPDGQTIYRLNGVSISNSSADTDLTNDEKYLISGIYALIKNTPALSGGTITVLRNNDTVLSQTIPANLTGVKFFEDPRYSETNLQNSVVPGDLISATPQPASGPSNAYVAYATDTAGNYSNGSDFNGTAADFSAYVLNKEPTATSIEMVYSNSYSSTPIKTSSTAAKNPDKAVPN